jgi:hypothetical protein
MLQTDDGAEFDFEEVTLRGGCGWASLIFPEFERVKSVHTAKYMPNV